LGPVQIDICTPGCLAYFTRSQITHEGRIARASSHLANGAEFYQSVVAFVVADCSGGDQAAGA
jgi:hypothetical protein